MNNSPRKPTAKAVGWMSSRYLDTIIVEHAPKIEKSSDVIINDDKVYDYINALMEVISGLLLVSFINFGIAIYHKPK